MIRTACLVVIALTATARADSAKLEAARAAVESVAYDEAAVLLTEALQEGGNSPAALTEIYRLSATTATVLGEHERAQGAYRRWLALDPKASLPTNAAVKFQDPFVAAQAFIQTKGALDLKIVKTDTGKLAVIVKSDPLGLAVSASLDGGNPETRKQIGKLRRVELQVPRGQAAVRVYVFDEFGNHLVARSFATFSEIPPETVVVTPFLRKWPVWAATSLVLAGVGYYVRRGANDAQADLDAIAGTTGEHFFGEIRTLEDRRDRNYRISTGLFIGAGAFAATAVVMYVIQPRARTQVIPTAEGGPGVAIVGRF